ncbi:uncharacterized protein [Miscanthus floridulus]|uniref:uncharacterized protein n=1 Tax=Miscanthus floridulus TaxID=154761 RepID=UPI00345B06B7
MSNENILVWNVRGLNGRAWRNVVRDFIVQERVSLVCLQETKLSNVCNQLASECLGTSFEYAFLPAVNTAGGVLLGWRTDAWSASHVSLQSHSVTAKITSRCDPRLAWWITVVYGSLDANDQQAFLNELVGLRSSLLGPWLICGDFNMIYRAADKNNDRLDCRCMRRFGCFLGAVAVEELHLNGRLFTWTNERLHPTLERIDRAFALVDWLELYPNHHMRALSSDCSDHAPLLLCMDVVPWARKRFRFESFWTKLHGFLDVVALAWEPTLLHADAFRIMDYNLRNVTISELPLDKALGPDGFIGLFYKVAWPIIKQDVVNAFNAFWSLDGRNFNLINDAFMILLKKKNEAQEICDYHPISLMHSFGKLIAKCLAHRLALVLNDLVHPCQSAFIQGRSIHDNFRAVQLTCKTLHQKKQGCLLLKIDIVKAFDSLWRCLADSSSGLSPSPSSAPLRCAAVRSRVSLYADDVVMFIKPEMNDIVAIKTILQIFGDALRRTEEQFLIDTVAARIPLWKGQLMNTAGRVALT